MELAQQRDLAVPEPQEFIAEGDQVVVLGRERLTAKPTNGSWESDWAMVWTEIGHNRACDRQ